MAMAFFEDNEKRLAYLAHKANVAAMRAGEFWDDYGHQTFHYCYVPFIILYGI